jgi:hypothetical protein
MPNIHIVTVATNPGGYLKWLEESCIRNGTKLIILGMGEKWKGYITKYLLMDNFLKTIPEDDIVCFIDAYDVLMTQHIDKLTEKFFKITENNDYKIICALDIGEKDLITKWYYESLDHTLINSGTYMGYSKNIKEVLKWMINEYNNDNNNSDDQMLLNKYYGQFKGRGIYIDNQKNIFSCEWTLFHEKKESDDFVFLHRCANGDMVSALTAYNYNIKIDEIIELKKIEFPYYIHKMTDHLQKYIHKILRELNK